MKNGLPERRVSNAFACSQLTHSPLIKRVVVETAQGRAADVSACAEGVEAVRPKGRAVVHRQIGRENLLVHLELAEVGRGVAEPLQHRSHVRQVGTEARHERILHLIDDAMELWRPPSQERSARSRAHRRGDVMVAECDAVPRDRIEGRQVTICPSQQPLCSLVDDDEEGVGLLGLPRDRPSRARIRTLTGCLACRCPDQNTQGEKSRSKALTNTLSVQGLSPGLVSSSFVMRSKFWASPAGES